MFTFLYVVAGLASTVEISGTFRQSAVGRFVTCQNAACRVGAAIPGNYLDDGYGIQVHPTKTTNLRPRRAMLQV